jgi:uncharacterized protein (DUF1697 family)
MSRAHDGRVTRYVALLRGINVGGHKRVAMADLRATLESLGHDEVSTLLQSGNALFTSPAKSPDQVARDIERAIDARHGMAVKVLVRTGPELAQIVDANPLPDAASEPSKLHVAFLSADPDAGRIDSLDAARSQREVIRPGKRALYIWYRDGAGRSKLTNDLMERRLGVTATSRNWNTVTKLADLANR